MDRNGFLSSITLGVLPLGQIRQELLPQVSLPQGIAGDQYQTYNLRYGPIAGGAGILDATLALFKFNSNRSLHSIRFECYALTAGVFTSWMPATIRLNAQITQEVIYSGTTGSEFTPQTPNVTDGAKNFYFTNAGQTVWDKVYPPGQIQFPAGIDVYLDLDVHGTIPGGQSFTCNCELIIYL